MYPRSANTIFVPRVADQFDVLTALGQEQRNQRGRIRPEYATAVFIAYIQNKMAKGRTRFEIGLKLQDLERGLPHLANSFRQARAQTGLPPSPLFPPPSSSPAVPASSNSQLGLLRTQSAYHPSSSATTSSMRRASTANMARPTATTATTVRPSDAEDNGEPPPPPYSRQDPEPEATAQLTRELSRLSTSAGGAAASSTSAAPRQGHGETNAAQAERERRELEEAIRLSRESAEQEEALRLSRESAEAEEMARLARERETHERTDVPPPLPARSTNPPSLLDDAPTMGTLAAPIQPIRTGSNNPFASALDAPHEERQVRYAPPPGPPPGHPGLPAQPTFTPPPGPSPGHPSTVTPPTNPFADSSAVSPTTHTPDLAILARYDTVILVDDSGSMAGDRWRQVRVALMDVVQRVVGAQESVVGQGEAEGVAIAFINSPAEGYNLTAPNSVEKLFNKVKPTNGTPTGAALQRILYPYMDQLEHVQQIKARGEQVPAGEEAKYINVIVLTDGAATDDMESPIVHVASRLDQGGFPLEQVGIQLIQIGNESEAREALQVLDDAIKEKHEVRDIVDTVVYDGHAVSAEQILKVLLGGIQRHLDERQVPRANGGYV
ncbi:hypothetical protein NliqN6_5910 [Naganishia liquefaciens]|uniref:VWFA domain-containing protein n=1 Tax=Naganishia liquefaciens TaxID=104408 RepID=A0A8H3TZ61_9TREE|nr:hypothetical protein NliqN6_5910 [Naganishia liquefaciens]